MAPRIALIHAVEVAIAPITSAFARLWPEARCTNLFDDSLSPDRAAEGEGDLSPRMTKRINMLADYAALTDADGILFTCSAFGPAIEEAARRLPIPVLKPNEAMFDQALAAGRRIGMLATFGPAVATMEAEFREAAQAARSDAELQTVLVAGAMDALKSGDAETHNRLVAEAAPKLRHCDAVLLAHFSTSRAKAAVEDALGREVLTSPTSAVTAIRSRISKAT
jgi:Asp/Glu/hydantoin racemase